MYTSSTHMHMLYSILNNSIASLVYEHIRNTDMKSKYEMRLEALAYRVKSVSVCITILIAYMMVADCYCADTSTRTNRSHSSQALSIHVMFLITQHRPADQKPYVRAGHGGASFDSFQLSIKSLFTHSPPTPRRNFCPIRLPWPHTCAPLMQYLVPRMEAIKSGQASAIVNYKSLLIFFAFSFALAKLLRLIVRHYWQRALY